MARCVAPREHGTWYKALLLLRLLRERIDAKRGSCKNANENEWIVWVVMPYNTEKTHSEN